MKLLFCLFFFVCVARPQKDISVQLCLHKEGPPRSFFGRGLYKVAGAVFFCEHHSPTFPPWSQVANAVFTYRSALKEAFYELDINGNGVLAGRRSGFMMGKGSRNTEPRVCLVPSALEVFVNGVCVLDLVCNASSGNGVLFGRRCSPKMKGSDRFF